MEKFQPIHNNAEFHHQGKHGEKCHEHLEENVTGLIDKIIMEKIT